MKNKIDNNLQQFRVIKVMRVTNDHGRNDERWCILESVEFQNLIKTIIIASSTLLPILLIIFHLGNYIDDDDDNDMT